MGVVKDSMAVYDRAYPVYLRVYDEEEADVVDEDTFESVAHAERFFEENYDRQGVSAGVYELTTVFRSDTSKDTLDALEDLKQQIEALLVKAKQRDKSDLLTDIEETQSRFASLLDQLREVN